MSFILALAAQLYGESGAEVKKKLFTLMNLPQMSSLDRLLLLEVVLGIVQQEEVSMSGLLFVYGSLKRGYWNHHYMKDCEFLCSTAVFGYAMFNVGFPMLVDMDDLTQQDHDLVKAIRGELWKVDDLARFDRLENEGALYNRVRDNVLSMAYEDEGVWLYVGHPDYKDIRYKAPLCYVNSDNEYEWRG